MSFIFIFSERLLDNYYKLMKTTATALIKKTIPCRLILLNILVRDLEVVTEIADEEILTDVIIAVAIEDVTIAVVTEEAAVGVTEEAVMKTIGNARSPNAETRIIPIGQSVTAVGLLGLLLALPKGLQKKEVTHLLYLPMNSSLNCTFSRFKFGRWMELHESFLRQSQLCLAHEMPQVPSPSLRKCPK